MTPSTPPHCDAPPTRSRRFRFKSESSRKAFNSRSRSPSSRSRRHQHHHGHDHDRSHRHHRSRRRDLSPPSQNDPSTCSALDPEAAFRESLFDAMADDEGAAFWEGVYGQPIHTYPRPRSKHKSDTIDDHPTDTENLNSMTDEEYVTYVRAKMWEKTHQHVLEEQRRREEAKSRRRQSDEEGRRLEKGVEEALRRGEERRRKARWKTRWCEYLERWKCFTEQAGGDAGTNPVEAIRKRIPWPVLSGMRRDVNQAEVERFFKHAPESSGAEYDANLLKLERVRWHPDKVQQKAGSSTVDEETMRTITAVFQIIDQLWSNTRS